MLYLFQNSVVFEQQCIVFLFSYDCSITSTVNSIIVLAVIMFLYTYFRYLQEKTVCALIPRAKSCANRSSILSNALAGSNQSSSAPGYPDERATIGPRTAAARESAGTGV